MPNAIGNIFSAPKRWLNTYDKGANIVQNAQANLALAAVGGPVAGNPAMDIAIGNTLMGLSNTFLDYAIQTIKSFMKMLNMFSDLAKGGGN